jgi:UDP-N-acetylglucosamine--N-acetylmuramyl-(pentapeptide) pyrophosphoryl-undecaprenol N-acetylglucosamine transferase
MSRFATVTGVNFPETAQMLSGRVIEVGTPLREGYKYMSAQPAAAREYFGLQPDKYVLLVFGGSQGAKAINSLLLECAPLFKVKNLQILHISGNEEITSLLRAAYQQADIHAIVKHYEERMDLAWQVADLALSRAGAVTIAEQLEFEVPAIFIPYPKATDNHQEQNAKFMRSTVGGAFMLREEGLSATLLKAHIEGLLNDSGSALKNMRHKMHVYKQTSRTRDLCDVIRELLRC